MIVNIPVDYKLQAIISLEHARCENVGHRSYGAVRRCTVRYLTHQDMNTKVRLLTCGPPHLGVHLRRVKLDLNVREINTTQKSPGEGRDGILLQSPEN
jgi:hypothetical protein